MWCGIIDIPFGYTAFSRLPVAVDFSALPLGIKLAACSVQMIPTLIVTLSFYYLVQLFNLYKTNVIFEKRNIVLIRKIGYTLIAYTIASLIAQPLLSLILTINAAAGQHVLAVGIGSDEISNLIIGAIVILISIIMAKGHKLQEEIALTV
jgi:hypothetical protein